MTLSPKLGVVEISTLWHFWLPLLIQMFIKVASSPGQSGIGMPSPILWSHLLKMQRIVLLSSLLWWELGTNSLITGPGEWLSFRRFTSKLSWSWSWLDYNSINQNSGFKASLTFKCMTEHLFADFSYSIALDTYLWKQMMQMNRKLIHIWYNVDKKHLLFTKRKCHKFSWLFTASPCSPRKRSICACRIACKVLVSIGLYSLSFGFLKKGFLLGKPCL